MKKITLFAGFSALAVAAMAVGPVAPKQVDFKAVKAQRIETMSTKAVSTKAALESRADDDVVVNGEPNYYTPGGFYTGFSNMWYGSSTGECRMFTPARGVTKFVPTAKFTESKWSWVEYELDENSQFQEAGCYFEGDTLNYPNFPYTQWASFMTLSGVNEDGEAVSYANPKVIGLLSGRNTEQWGMSDEETGTYGLTPVSSGTGNMNKNESPYIWGAFYGFDKTDEQGNENGVYSKLYTGAGAAFPEAEYSDLKLVAYHSTMPSPGSYYQLSGIYFLCRSVNSEDVSVDVTVYEMDEEGNLSEKPVGKGSAIIPANTAEEEFYDFLTVELSGVNKLGYTTNRPICSDKALYLTIDGTAITGEAAESFYMMMYGTQLVSPAEWDAQNYWRKLYPSRAQVIYSMTDKATGETVVDADPYIHAYYADQTNPATSDLKVTNNFFLYYNLEFPQVFDAYTGSDSFEVNVDNGPVEVNVDGSYDFAQLYDDGTMKAAATADWINFEVSYNEEHQFTVVTVSGEALPDGVTGRTGEINFTGYACDFTITVVQGDGGEDQNGISSIKVSANGASEFFDLQGRKLNGAPANGLYIERNGKTASTKVAR